MTDPITITLEDKDHEVRKMNLPLILKCAPFMDTLAGTIVDVFKSPDANSTAGYEEETIQTEGGYQKTVKHSPADLAAQTAEIEHARKTASQVVKLVTEQANLHQFLTIVAFCIPSLLDDLPETKRWDKALPSQDAIDHLVDALPPFDLGPIALKILEANMGAFGEAGKKILDRVSRTANSETRSDSAASTSGSPESTGATGPSTTSPSGVKPSTNEADPNSTSTQSQPA